MKSILVPVLSLFLALPLVARAGDLCLDAAAGSTPTYEKPVIIGRTFRLPARNKCKPFMGVFAATSQGIPTAVTGTACTSWDGVSVRFTLVASHTPTDLPGGGYSTGYSMLYSATLDTRDDTGALTAIHGNTLTTSPITAYECRNAYPDNL